MPVTLVEEILKVAIVTTKYGNGAVGISTGQKGADGKDQLEFLSFNDNCNVPVTDLEKGGTYNFQLLISSKGKRYVNKVLSLEKGDFVTKTKSYDEVSKPSMTSTKPSSMSTSNKDAYWEAKDKRISRQGIIQVAVRVADAWEESVELADKMLEFVNQK